MLRATLLLLTLFFLSATSSTYAQEWQTNAAVDTLVTTNILSGVSSVFASGNIVFASGLRSDLTGYSLFYSDDDGNTWTESTSDADAGSYSVFASNDDGTLYNYGFDIFGGRYLRTSTDMGLTWVNMTPDGANFPVIFLPQHMVASGSTILLTGAGANAPILRSTDGGASWTTFTNFSGTDAAKDLADLAKKDNTFWVASNEGGLYKAASDASQWELVREFGMQGGVDIFDILVNQTTGRVYITTTNGLEYSDDDGDSWTTIMAPTLGINDGTPDGLVSYGDNLVLQMANGANSVMYLIDDLETATAINDGLGAFESNNRFLNLVSTSSRIFGIRISQETSLWQFGAGMSTSSVDEEALPEFFTLDQNYPNPFNPTTNISFSLTKAGYVNVYVSNTLGQRVATLKEGFLPSGSHEIQFDATGLSGGIYLYTLEASTGKDTRLMTLIK